MEIIAVVKNGNLDQVGAITFRHNGKRMTLSTKEAEELYNASNAAVLDHVFGYREPRCKYPDPSELPEKMPVKKRNRQIYEEYLFKQFTMPELAERYNLKLTTIKNIISDLRCRDRFYQQLQDS